MSSATKIDYEVLRAHFHLPISQVAKELGVFATVLKKLCRRHGIPRWPHRKIKSINKMIAALEQSEPATEEEEQEKQAELIALRKRKEYIMENPHAVGSSYSHSYPKYQGETAIIGKFSASANIQQTNDISLQEQSVLRILDQRRRSSAPHLSHHQIKPEHNNIPNSIATSRFSFDNTASRLPEMPFPFIAPMIPDNTKVDIWAELDTLDHNASHSGVYSPHSADDITNTGLSSSGNESGNYVKYCYPPSQESNSIPIHTRYSPVYSSQSAPVHVAQASDSDPESPYSSTSCQSFSSMTRVYDSYSGFAPISCSSYPQDVYFPSLLEPTTL